MPLNERIRATLSHTATGVHLRRSGANQQPVQPSPMSIGQSYGSGCWVHCQGRAMHTVGKFRGLLYAAQPVSAVEIAHLQASI